MVPSHMELGNIPKQGRFKSESCPLPEAFKARMKRLLGAEFDAFMDSCLRESLQALRLNPLKYEKKKLIDLFGQGTELASFFHLKRVDWEECGFYFEREDEPGRSAYHDAGVYYIQEPSAQFPVNLLEVSPDDQRILDLCAAPGGKSTQIAAKMEGKGILIANEIHPARAGILSGNIERMGVRNAVVLNETPKHLAECFSGCFDRILVDAPCSGEGMFRKNPEAIAQWSVENVRLCAERQKEILEYAEGMLKPGGRLVYSTCTFSEEENEEVIEAFLKKHPDYELKEQRRLYPHREMCEGHFAAALEKKAYSGSEGTGFVKNGLQRSLPRKEVMDFYGFAKEALKEDNSLKLWDGEAKEHVFLRFGDNLYLAPEGTPSLKGIRVLRPGLQLGTGLKNRFVPSHALALALRPEDVNRALKLKTYLTGELLGDGAVPTTAEPGRMTEDYLKGLTFPAGGENGWHLICADCFSLGWGKLSNGIMKNHYPRGLRRQ